ncbi:MAG TPA: ArsB/NhaD family transporter [Clostridia bacterium]|nr:ArsB/NhaD family transporter [Clostridia bacterium]
MIHMLENHILVAVIVFALTYSAIIYEKINRMVVALAGAVLMIIFQVLSQEHAIRHIDFNTIGLLIGMMVIVLILKRTGVFQYIAIKSAKKAKGEPWKIMVLFAVATAVASALLDNVTTILLIAPVTLVITDTLKINPTPFLITEVFAANVGGTATLIGDPPNIMIGGATHLSFMEFLINLGPIAAVILVVTITLLVVIFRRSMLVEERNKGKVLEFDEGKAIQDKKLLVKSMIILGITITGFTMHSVIQLESATVAITGAVALLLVSGIEPEDIFMEIEWTTIFFFAGLFILVGSLEEVGLIEKLAVRVMGLTKGNLFVAAMLILWMSAILSAFLDNIPFVATMIPLIKSLEAIAGTELTTLWWALSLGACLGGNGTIIGATANVIAGGMLEKHGWKLGFFNYMKVCFPLMLVSIFLSMLYIIIFYL